ncbi:hypothetical protein STW0522ENT60_P12180 (plasmid) [Enterobacter kobei]|nr:hypothetical protein STW0522ENT60_P12180 [Enterobacter kobei]
MTSHMNFFRFIDDKMRLFLTRACKLSHHLHKACSIYCALNNG